MFDDTDTSSPSVPGAFRGVKSIPPVDSVTICLRISPKNIMPYKGNIGIIILYLYKDSYASSGLCRVYFSYSASYTSPVEPAEVLDLLELSLDLRPLTLLDSLICLL